MFAALRYADLAQRGLWPVGGGAMDQSPWFVDAVQFIWCEQAIVKARLA